MRMEPVIEATKLKTVIYLLEKHVSRKVWEQLAMPIADAIAKLNSQAKQIRELKLLLDEARSDRDYWQHKWGNGNG